MNIFDAPRTKGYNWDYVENGAGGPIVEDHLVEFRLIFEGDLPSAGNKSRPKDKHRIRKALHPQLKRLWGVNPSLRGLAEISGVDKDNLAGYLVPSDMDRFSYGIKQIGENWNKAGFDLVPLVTEKISVRCSLDILLLRPGDSKHVFRQGDIDGQLKTLFDALRLPANAEETGRALPDDDEKPLFCLLEDDRLITQVRVKTDELLMLPNKNEVDANDAHVVIHVKINHKYPTTFDNYFG